jgi:hypothetical protein
MSTFRQMLWKIPRPSPALLIGLLALAVASTGTAVAATGQIVNIADPTAPSQIAKVDASGHLKTVASQGVPARPFSITDFFYDRAVVPDNTLVPPTDASVAVDRMIFSLYSAMTNRRTLYVYQYGLNSVTDSCQYETTYRFVGVYDVGPGAAAVDEPSSPIVLRPSAVGKPAWCLVVEAWPAGAGEDSSYYGYGTISGFVTSGSLPSGIGTSAPLSGKAERRAATRAPGAN